MVKNDSHRRTYFASAGFSNIPRKNENVVFIIKNPRNRNKFFKSNSQIMKIKKYYEISTINECVEKNDNKKIVFAVLTHSRNNCAAAG